MVSTVWPGSIWLVSVRGKSKDADSKSSHRLLSFLRSLTVSWRWLKSHWESSSMPLWPAKTWTRPGRRPFTKSSVNWTVRFRRFSSPPTVFKSSYTSKKKISSSLNCFLWIHQFRRIVFTFPQHDIWFFFLFFERFWSSIPYLKPLRQFLKDLALCYYILTLTIDDYYLFVFLMSWIDLIPLGCFFFWTVWFLICWHLFLLWSTLTQCVWNYY